MSDHHAKVEVKIGSERNFGIVFAVVFVIIALWPIFGDDAIRPAFLVAALVVLGIASLAPGLLRIPNRLWFRFGMLLGALIAPIVMLLVYLTTFVPIGLLMRMFGMDPLKMHPDSTAKSYWVERKDKPQSMKNQF